MRKHVLRLPVDGGNFLEGGITDALMTVDMAISRVFVELFSPDLDWA
jgi:hypothetical protein